MRFSNSFIKTLRDAPKEETARGAQYLARAGYVHKELAGVYDYLPLGLRVLEHIKRIIREELNALGCEELLLTSLQNPDLWAKTDRWDIKKMDIWFRTTLSAGGELGLAPTHEEPITELMKTYIKSYKDLPVAAYQIQTKFRNELRAKSGIMRGREFIMKDLYSFSATADQHDTFYHEVELAYKNIFARLGLGDCTYQTFASGGVFAKYSHEFQTLVDVGEDTIYFNSDKSVVLNEEVLTDEVLEEFHVRREDLTSARAAEVGNIFTLKTKYSAPLGLEFMDESGQKQPVLMGCYGIGVSRLMGVIAEKFADDRGLVWPESVAPYQYYLIGIGEKGTKKAEELYQRATAAATGSATLLDDHNLQQANIDTSSLFDSAAPFNDRNSRRANMNTSPLLGSAILFDDRDLRPGEKFADAELMGIPKRIVIGDRSLEKGEAELTDRHTGTTELIPISALENL